MWSYFVLRKVFFPFDFDLPVTRRLFTRMSNYISTAEEGAHYAKEVYDLVDKNELKIQIFKDYPFTTEGVQNAQRDLTGGKTSGKLLIKV